MKNEKGTVNHRSSESKMEKMKCESLKLGPRGLFETIQGLMQFTHIAWISRVHIPKRLLQIHLFLEKSMQESIRTNSNCQNKPYNSRLDH